MSRTGENAQVKMLEQSYLGEQRYKIRTDTSVGRWRDLSVRERDGGRSCGKITRSIHQTQDEHVTLGSSLGSSLGCQLTTAHNAWGLWLRHFSPFLTFAQTQVEFKQRHQNRPRRL